MRVGGTALWYAEPYHTEDLEKFIEAVQLFFHTKGNVGSGVEFDNSGRGL